jgi:hypothetical protein
MLLVELLQLMIKTIGIYILCVIIIISISYRQNNALNIYLVMVSLLYRFYTLAAIAPDSSYNKKNTAILEIVDILQDQIKRNSSNARIKMFGDIHVTAGWLSWLLN